MPIPRKHTLSETSPSNGLVEFADAEEISEPEILNLSDVGRQMVEKALERNNGNRKKAAQELGISDRTLYRRIKQYGWIVNKLRKIHLIYIIVVLMGLTACSVSYKFNGASINLILRCILSKLPISLFVQLMFGDQWDQCSIIN